MNEFAHRIRSLFTYCVKQVRDDWLASAVFCVTIAAGVVLVFVTPPFQVPDEPAHTYRAISISNGSLLCGNSDYTVRVPVAFTALEALYPREQVIFSEFGFQRYSEPSLQVSDTAESIYTQFCAYNPLTYGIAVIALWFGSLFTASSVGLLLFVRMAHLLVAALLTYAAVRIIPFGKPVIAMFVLVPVMLFEMSSASIDAIAIPLLLFFTAVVIFAARLDRLTHSWLAGLTMLSIVAVHAKPGYIVFILLLALIRQRQVHSKQVYLYWLGITIALHVVMLYLLSLIGNADGYYNQYANINAGEQLKFILSDPSNFVRLIYNDIVLNSFTYMHQIFGYFGWLSVAVHPGVVVIGVALYVWLLTQWFEEVEMNNRFRLILALTSGIGLFSIFTIAYLAWNPVMDVKICCTQGRYFLPYLWLGALALWHLRVTRLTWSVVALSATLFLVVSMVSTLLQKQYGF